MQNTGAAQIEPKAQFKSGGVSFASFEELMEAFNRRNPADVIEEVNAYTDPETKRADFYTLRLVPQRTGKKEFRQISRSPSGRWHWRAPEGKLPLFNRIRVRECDTVLICEGEKCVREFTKLGMENIAATTSPGGSINALKADWSILAGKRCVVWRDNDAPGEKYETDVIEILLKLAPPCSVARVRVEELELEAKDDLVDYLESVAGTTEEKRAAIHLVLQDAEPLNVTEALSERLARIASGAFRAIAFPQMPLASDLSKALMPGTLTTLCGEPGAGKTFFMLENFWRLNLEKNVSVKLLMLEDDAAFYQTRVLAQMSGYADLTDVDFCEANMDFVRSVFEQHRPHLEYFFRNLETVQSAQKTLDEIALWVKAQAEAGVEVIGVDPVTAAKVSDKPYIDDQRFLFQVKESLEKTGARLVLTTHPRLGQAGKPSLSGMAGGASYPRFSQTVLWLKNYDKFQESNIYNGAHRLLKRHKQSLEIRKARNGKGQGTNLAVNLNFQNLCLDELGIIEAE